MCSSPQRHVLLLLLHHIAERRLVAGPAVRATWRGPMRRGVAAGAGLAGLPVQYADYTLWQHSCWAARATPTARWRSQLAFWTTALAGAARAARSARRPAAARGRQLSRRHRAGRLDAELHRAPAGAGPRQPGEPVHGAAGRPCGSADPAGRRHRHSDRQPDRRAHRQRARRPGRLLRQHPGAAHRHVRQSELPRTGGPGAGVRSGGLRAIRICRSSGWSRRSTRHARWRGIRCSR